MRKRRQITTSTRASMRRRTAGTLAGLALACAAGHPLLADDTEVFLGFDPGITPNLLLIIDTSGSMAAEVETQVPFDAATSWQGNCDPNRVYWRQNTGTPPDCDTPGFFEAAALRCQASTDAFAQSGFYTDRTARWEEPATRWRPLDDEDATSFVECRGDQGLHGDGSNLSKLWAANGAAGPWSADPADEVSWSDNETGDQYTLYSGNYLNWFHEAPTTVMTRLEIVQNVARDLVNSISGVNLGLMRFSDTDQIDAEGGMVIHAVADVETARATIITELFDLQPNGFTPLSETLFEAAQYLRGDAVDYGLDSVPQPSVPESRLPGDLYRSPIEFECQKNFVIFLTDGEPTTDLSADAKITALPDFGTLIGPGCDGNGDGACLDDLAEWLFEADLSALPGQQNARTFTIGFTIDLPLLADTAARGGGQYYLADDTATLATALANIVTQIQQQATTFTAPAVAVNAFNSTRNLNELFVGVFEPAQQSHWPGNLKKYRIDGDRIVGVDGADVVDPATGFFRADARSFWPDPLQPIDGGQVRRGGAANQLPAPASRRLFTYLGNASLIVPGNAVERANALITDVLLGGGAPGDPSRDELIDFARGIDAADSDLDGDTSEPRRQMGDPLHSAAQAVVYGGTAASPDLDDALVLIATNDGYLHAVDPVDGQERWAFVPVEVLDRSRDLFVNEPVANKGYGLDGSLRVFRLDRNNNGIIEPGDNDAVYLFFGMRRGGDTYFALDITDKDAPRLMWQRDGTDLPFLGQTWSTPFVTRIQVAGAAQNSDNLVVIFAGGYDTGQDNEAYSTDALGNGLYIVDALDGDLLWRTGSDGPADLALAEMNNAIPANVRVLDMNSDGFADRMYVGDMGGRLWRFDISNGESAAGLVAGGVIARLGAGGIPGAALADNRRFYNTPDVALIPADSGGYLSIGIGSGYRAHPLNTNIRDGFFAVRDVNVFNRLTQADYDALSPATIGDLIDVTDNPAAVPADNSRGWRLELRDPGLVGEKVLAEATTFLGTTFFTTFTPAPSGDSCVPGAGINRLFQVSVRAGAPVNNLDGIGSDLDLTVNDRAVLLPQGGIAPSPTFLFPTCTGPDCPDVIGLVGLVQFDPGDFPPFFRTYWTTEGAQQ